MWVSGYCDEYADLQLPIFIKKLLRVVVVSLLVVALKLRSTKYDDAN